MELSMKLEIVEHSTEGELLSCIIFVHLIGTFFFSNIGKNHLVLVTYHWVDSNFYFIGHDSDFYFLVIDITAMTVP